MRRRAESPAAPPVYSRAERIADGAVHALGVLLALVSVPVLITLTAVFDGAAPTVAAVSIYGVAMVGMFAASAAYHLMPLEAWREPLRRVDHAMIYIKIAATQTPFAVMVGGARGLFVLGLIWLAALAGAAAKALRPSRLVGPMSTALYLALGWGGLALVLPGPDAIPLAPATVALIAAGGALYTAGVAFLLMRTLPFHNAIWHGFVLAATFVFYAAVLTEIVLRGMGD
ncbi:MAG: PAQR family membrane homeostasis protein TrhA [Rubrimonas sp.]